MKKPTPKLTAKQKARRLAAFRASVTRLANNRIKRAAQ